jgi:hypothetical protein
MKFFGKALRETLLCRGEDGRALHSWAVKYAGQWHAVSKTFVRKVLRRVFNLSPRQTDCTLGSLITNPVPLSHDLPRLPKSCSPEHVSRELSAEEAVLLGIVSGLSRPPRKRR